MACDAVKSRHSEVSPVLGIRLPKKAFSCRRMPEISSKAVPDAGFPLFDLSVRPSLRVLLRTGNTQPALGCLF